MKVLLQSYDTFNQNAAGGVQTKINNLYKGLKELGVHVDLFNKWEHKIEDYDVIHFVKLSYEQFGLLVYAKNKNKKIVISTIVPVKDKFKIRIALFLNKIFKLQNVYSLQKSMLALADNLIVESSVEKEYLINIYKVEGTKISIIPSSINENMYNGNCDLFKKKYNMDKNIILMVGRIDKNKNQLNVIKAVKDLDVPLVIVGGPDPADMEYFEKCKKFESNKIIFTGWLKNNDPLLFSAFKCAKVVILVSYFEIYGNVVYEGFINGCNVVASNVVPTRDWGLHRYTYFVNPNNHADIKNKIELAYLNDNLNDNVVELSKNIFSISSVAHKHIDVYR